MKPKETKIVTPSPYFNIIFNCSNRGFYDVKNNVEHIASQSNIKEYYENVSEECDFEGDLYKITIHRHDEEFVQAILKHYGINLKDVPDDMEIVLSIY